LGLTAVGFRRGRELPWGDFSSVYALVGKPIDMTRAASASVRLRARRSEQSAYKRRN
jgi:hypothetical protein